MRGKAFVSGPMTGLPNFNRPAFHDAVEKLRRAGWFVISPTILPIGMEHEEYMHICEAMIDVCDMVYMLDGWAKSRGARREFNYAVKTGKQIVYDFPVINIFVGGVA